MAAALPIAGILCGLVCAYMLPTLWRFTQHRRYYRNLPGPPHNFLFGHFPIFMELARVMPPNVHPQILYTEIARKYNLEGIFYLDLYPLAPSSVIITDPELLKQLQSLRQHPTQQKSAWSFVHPHKIDTEYKLNLNNALSSAVSSINMRKLAFLLADKALVFAWSLRELVDGGKAFQIKDPIFAIVLSFLASSTLDCRLRSEEVKDFGDMVLLAEQQLGNSSVAINPTTWAKIRRKRQELAEKMNGSLNKKIQGSADFFRRHSAMCEHTHTTILGSMLEGLLPTKNVKKSDGRIELSGDELNHMLAIIKSTFFSGQGTTVDATCYTLMLLSECPRVMAKLRDEHDTFFGRCPKIFDIDSKENRRLVKNIPLKINDLAYTDAVIKETMRLFPAGFTLRQAEHDATITHNGGTYPLGNSMAVVLQNHDINYNVKFFPKPTKFFPERWLDTNPPLPSYENGACPGMGLGQNMIKIILIFIVRDFDFKCVGIRPNYKPKTLYTDLDTVFGDIVFQELGLEAKLRGKMNMSIRRRSDGKDTAANS